MIRTRSDVIVVGGGVAGLAAAAALGRARFRVLLLEARDRLGGRILTARPNGWPMPVELGAEFVHAGNPAFWRIVRRHRLRVTRMPSRHSRFAGDGKKLQRVDDLAERLEGVTKQIDAKRMAGWTFAQFLRRAGEQISPEDRELVSGFVEGFEAAPLERMSAAAMEGQTLDDEEQFRLPDGYDGFVAALVRDLPADHVRVLLNSVVSAITWRRGEVTIRAGANEHVARAVVVTLPLGVWQSRSVRFAPSLRAKAKIAASMGMGHVTRVAVRFDPNRWRSLVPVELKRDGRRGFGFIHSRIAGVPVWWQLTLHPVVTGWAGGPAALKLTHRSEAEVRESALRSLARLWSVPLGQLRRAVRGWSTHVWSRDPFSAGAYSFAKAGSDEAGEQLREPVADTLFFAGEATADGEEVGTVHGALASGQRAAEEVQRAVRNRVR
jgi:monoamine oxidase